MKVEKMFLQTNRRKIAYIRKGDTNKPKLILIHGNASGSAFYIPLMTKLEKNYDVIALDLNGYGQTEASPINASTGLYDWSEDIDSFVSELGIENFALLGWSLGGGVAMKYTTLHSEKVAKLILISPMSPYGFGGTYDVDGKLVGEDGIGSSGGFANQDFINALVNKDRSDSPNSARDVIYKTYFKPGFKLDKELEDIFVDEILDMKLGEDYYPGDYKSSLQFPYVLPGLKGINNTLSPQYANVSNIVDIPNKPDILWFRGDSDLIVSDTSFSDLAYLGKLGILPNYPGEEKFPIQPMVSQTRYILEKYKQNGGNYFEFLIKDTAHSCHIEKEEEFVKILIENI